MQQFIKSKENARHRTIGAARTRYRCSGIKISKEMLTSFTFRWSVMKKRDVAAIIRAGPAGASAPEQKTTPPIAKPPEDVAIEDIKPVASSSKTIWTKFEVRLLLGWAYHLIYLYFPGLSRTMLYSNQLSSMPNLIGRSYTRKWPSATRTLLGRLEP